MLRFQLNTAELLDLGVSPLVVILLIPLSVIIPLVIVKIVYSRKQYRCTECENIFRPNFLQTHLGYYQDLSVTERGRNQYCPKCGKITWCKYYPEDD